MPIFHAHLSDRELHAIAAKLIDELGAIDGQGDEQSFGTSKHERLVGVLRRTLKENAYDIDGLVPYGAFVDQVLDWQVEQIHSLQRASEERTLLAVRRVLDEHLSEVTRVVGSQSSGCRYAANDDEVIQANYMSMFPVVGGKRVQPNPQGFLDKLKEFAQSSTHLVIVDPYALAGTDDAGNKRAEPVEICELIDARSRDAVVIYCRRDATDDASHKFLTKRYGNKIKIEFGDLHDRYMLCSSEENTKGARLATEWLDCLCWGGVVFGASFNGVSKRPTYLLKFDPQDIPLVVKYLVDASASPKDENGTSPALKDAATTAKTSTGKKNRRR